MAIRQLSVFLENRAGQLAEITQALSNAGLDIRAINIAETSDYGILRLIPAEVDKAAEVLNGQGFITSITSVVATAIPDEPGALNKMLAGIASENINISYMYSIFGHKQGAAYMVIAVDDPDALEAGILAAGYQVATEDQLGAGTD